MHRYCYDFASNRAFGIGHSGYLNLLSVRPACWFNFHWFDRFTCETLRVGAARLFRARFSFSKFKNADVRKGMVTGVL